MSLPSPRYYKYLPKLLSLFLVVSSLLNPVVAVFADQDATSTSSVATTYYRPIIVEFRNAKQLSDKELYLQYILSIPLSATTSAEFLVDQVTYTPTSTPRNEVNYIDLEVPENALDSFINAFNRGSEENVINLSNSSTTLTNNEEGVLLNGSSTIEEVSNGSPRVQSDTEISTSSETVLGVGFAFPFLAPGAAATSTIFTSTNLLATTTDTVYYPFSGYNFSSSTISTYLTLNGVLVGTYTYQKGNEASTGKITYVLSDFKNTPVLETDDKGDIIEADMTDVFGNYVYRDQRVDNALHMKGYIGQEYDDTTSLLYVHARLLNSATHSFMSVDPMLYSLPQSYLTDPQQMNSYAYARNNPVVYSDPTGKSPFAIIAAIVAIVNFFIQSTDVAKAPATQAQARGTSQIDQSLNKAKTTSNYATVAVTFGLGSISLASYLKSIGTKTAVSTDVISSANSFSRGVVNDARGSTALSNVTVESNLKGGVTTYLNGGVRDLTQDLKVLKNNPNSLLRSSDANPEGFYRNETYPKLPERDQNYYNEYNTLPQSYHLEGKTPPERFIRGRGDEIYYSPDHYKTFYRLE